MNSGSTGGMNPAFPIIWCFTSALQFAISKKLEYWSQNAVINRDEDYFYFALNYLKTCIAPAVLGPFILYLCRDRLNTPSIDDGMLHIFVALAGNLVLSGFDFSRTKDSVRAIHANSFYTALGFGSYAGCAFVGQGVKAVAQMISLSRN